MVSVSKKELLFCRAIFCLFSSHSLEGLKIILYKNRSKMIEVNSDILVLVIGIVLGLLIIKLLAKFIFRLVGTLVLIIIGFSYVYFYTDFFEEHQDNAIVQAIEDKIEVVSVIEFNENHCKKGPKTKTDSITCECIIAPLVKDLNARFSKSELELLMHNKQQYIKEIMAALKRNQSDIIADLKERKAIHIWNNIVKNLKRGKFLERD